MGLLKRCTTVGKKKSLQTMEFAYEFVDRLEILQDHYDLVFCDNYEYLLDKVLQLSLLQFSRTHHKGIIKSIMFKGFSTTRTDLSTTVNRMIFNFCLTCVFRLFVLCMRDDSSGSKRQERDNPFARLASHAGAPFVNSQLRSNQERTKKMMNRAMPS